MFWDVQGEKVKSGISYNPIWNKKTHTNNGNGQSSYLFIRTMIKLRVVISQA